MSDETLQIRVYGEAARPTLIYLPGLHGDWTLIRSFRGAIQDQVRFVEFTYPRTTSWSLEDYRGAIAQSLVKNGISHGWLLAESFGSQIAWPLCHACEIPMKTPTLVRTRSTASHLLSEEADQTASRFHLARKSDGMSAPAEHTGGGPGDRLPASSSASTFTPDGLILAGGFVRHPVRWGVRGVRFIVAQLPLSSIRSLLRVYAWYARFRHRHAPETGAAIPEFVARRTELDRQAIVHRLDLIAANNPGAIAQHVQLPVFYLAGLVDPLVPWAWVRLWLRFCCPQYRGGKTYWRADHNVLATAPAASARQVVTWMREFGGTR